MLQHEVADPHVVINSTQALAGLLVTILGLVTGSWRLGKAMGEFAGSQRELTKEVRTGFETVNTTLEKHGNDIHKLKTSDQAAELELALLAQHTKFRRREE